MMKNYDFLIGLTKSNLIKILGGDQFNDPHSMVWSYFLGKTFWGRRKYLYVYFDNDVIVSVRTSKK